MFPTLEVMHRLMAPPPSTSLSGDVEGVWMVLTPPVRHSDRHLWGEEDDDDVINTPPPPPPTTRHEVVTDLLPDYSDPPDEAKYRVFNRDTGEVMDIRDIDKIMSSNCNYHNSSNNNKKQDVLSSPRKITTNANATSTSTNNSSSNNNSNTNSSSSSNNNSNTNSKVVNVGSRKNSSTDPFVVTASPSW